MTDKIDKATGSASRQDRLKSALRENLKRRKQQTRERDRLTEPSHGEEGPQGGDTAGKSGG